MKGCKQVQHFGILVNHLLHLESERRINWKKTEGETGTRKEGTRLLCLDSGDIYGLLGEAGGDVSTFYVLSDLFWIIKKS